MSLSDRIRAAFEHNAPLSQAGLARACGISRASVNAWVSGKTESIDGKFLTTAAAYLKVSAHWLSTGEGKMQADKSLPENSFPLDRTKVRHVFVVGRGSGGVMPERIWTDGDYPVGAIDECAEVATNDPHAFITQVTGTSMIPRYNPGEYALVEPATDPELEDDVLVRLKTGHTMVKRLLSRRDGYRFGSYNDPEILHYSEADVTWVYYIAHPVPRRKIKTRC